MTKWDGYISGMQGWLHRKLLTINFLIVSAWHWAFGCWGIHFKDIYVEEKNKEFQENFRAYGILLPSEGVWMGPAVHMKRRHDLKGSCWSSVLQIKSKQALCNSLLCFYFFLVLYCCLSFPNTINVPCQLYILNPNSIVFSPRIWHLFSWCMSKKVSEGVGGWSAPVQMCHSLSYLSIISSMNGSMGIKWPLNSSGPTAIVFDSGLDPSGSTHVHV